MTFENVPYNVRASAVIVSQTGVSERVVPNLIQGGDEGDVNGDADDDD